MATDNSHIHNHEHHGHTHEHSGHGHSGHEGMIRDFQIRFWISLVLTIPILLLSPMFMMIIGLEGFISFRGEGTTIFVLSSIVYFYGGWPFLKGLYSELKNKSPGMMTLIGVAITAAYVFSSAVL
jgi:Cu2+-exporting ATPase